MKYEDFVMDRNDRDSYPRLDFVIAKYDPAKYDSAGVYTDYSEWTSSDEALNNGLEEEYMTIENAYVNFFSSVLCMKNCQRLVIHMWSGFKDAIEYSEALDTSVIYRRCKHLKDYSTVGIQTACDLLKLSLRGVLDCSLVNMSRGIEFMVGYEYYLHMRCGGIDYRALEHLAESFGLYLNPRERVSTKDIKYNQLLCRLQGAKTGDMIRLTDFAQENSQNYLYETLFFSDTILSEKRPRQKAAIILSKPHSIKRSVFSWKDLEPFRDEARLIVFQFGRKVKIGKDAILIGNHPMEWKEYCTKNEAYLVYL